MFRRFFNIVSYNQYNLINKLIYVLILIAFLSAIGTYVVLINQTKFNTPDPNLVLGMALVDLIVLLSLAIVLGRKIISYWYKKSLGKGSKLYNQISTMFAIVSFVPTIIVAIFSTYFFYFGLQAWFDKRIEDVLNQSEQVAELYIREHKIRLKETALSLAQDLQDMYYQLVQNPKLFEEILNVQSEMRSLNEAIVFQASTNSIIAQTSLSFSLSFSKVPQYLVDKAKAGEIVELNNDKSKIQVLIKLQGYEDIFLIIGRIIDEKIMDHVDSTNGAIADYTKLKGKIIGLQVKFLFVYILVAILLLFAAFCVGILFAAKIIQPINKLLVATKKVRSGNLKTQVRIEPSNNEIDLLVRAFNVMTQKLDHQQQDLLIAQRALAWSDVARRVAHEIKNPLTAILLSSERISKKFSHEVSDKESFEKYLNNIFRCSNNIKTILSEFVNFAKLPKPVFKVCDVVKLIQDIIDSRKVINDTITYEFDSNVENYSMKLDEGQFNQVMVNLLKNSEESITENNSPQSVISVSLHLDKEELLINIKDTGGGFAPKLMEKVTEAYFTTKSKGTGLGLAIVKKIIHDHHGNIEISNDEESRAVVSLKFYLEDLEQEKVFEQQNH